MMVITITTITKMILISILTWVCDEEDAEMHKFSAIMVWYRAIISRFFYNKFWDSIATFIAKCVARVTQGVHIFCTGDVREFN
jgi:hypothetical protein